MLTDEELMLLVQLEYLYSRKGKAAGAAGSPEAGNEPAEASGKTEVRSCAAGSPEAGNEPAADSGKTEVRNGSAAASGKTEVRSASANAFGAAEKERAVLPGSQEHSRLKREFLKQEERAAILRVIRKNKHLLSLYVWGRDDNVFATCYRDAEGKAYVTFRGTSTGEEWLDNLEGSFAVDTKSQKEALEYVEALPFDRITVAGHSKGGNKAQYVALLSDKVDRCVSMDSQGFSREFVEAYSARIAANSYKIKNYSLATDYVHVQLLEVPGAQQIYCQGDQRFVGLGNHSPAAFYQYYRDENGVLQIVLNDRGQTNLILTTENEGIHCLHEFTCFLLEHVPDDRRERAVRYLGNTLALTMRKEYTVCENGEVYTHDTRIAYIFSDQETAAFLIAYLLKFSDTNELTDEQFLSLLDAFGLKDTYLVLMGLTLNMLGTTFYERGKSFRGFLLSSIKSSRRNFLIEAALGIVHKTWLKRHLQKKVGTDFDPRKLWRDIQKEYSLIENV